MIGYTIGIFEKMITPRLSKFTFKIIFSIALMIGKVFIFPIAGLAQALSLGVQGTMVVLSMIVDLLKENEDRRTFKSSHDYRESHSKFRNLMVSGLPTTSLLIISRDLQQKLFSNQCLENTLKEDASQESQNQVEILHEWLGNLMVEYKSLNKPLRSTLSFEALSPSVLDLLRSFEQKVALAVMTDHKISLSAEYSKGENPSKKIYEINISSIVWDAQDAIAIIINDVTVNSMNQRLKIADSNKDKMLAMVSHELRTPINGILGVVRILQNQTKDIQTLQYLSICKSSGELLYNLVNSILDLQQIRDRKFSLKITKHDLYELLNDVQDLFRLQFEEKSLYIHLEIDTNVPQFIVTDHNRLRQILINLIGNALKFTFEGGVLVSVQMDPEQKNHINFAIEDTGIGIKEEDQPKLFKMYGRLDQADPKTNTQGVGFGLEISNQLARLLADGAINGGIRFTSQVGKGTKFSFSIKDNTVITHDDFEEIDFFEPQAFDEDIENLSLKISPYSIPASSFTEKDLSLNKLSPPPLALHKRVSCLLPGSSPKNLRGTNPRAAARNLLHTATKSKFLHYNSCNLGQSSDFQTRDGLSAEAAIFNSPRSPRNNRNLVERGPNSKSVLIIDDNSFNLLVAKHLIEGLGYHVETALNGKLGISLIKSHLPANQKPFDLILMDLQMPVMDGYESARILKQMMANKELAEIPIIALSANDSEDDKARCKEVGMSKHLSKPLNEGQLRRILGYVLEKDVSLGSLCDDESEG